MKAVGANNRICQLIEANILNAIFVLGGMNFLHRLDQEYRDRYDGKVWDQWFCDSCYHLGHTMIQCESFRCFSCNKWAPGHTRQECPSCCPRPHPNTIPPLHRSKRLSPNSSIATSSESSTGLNASFPRRKNPARKATRKPLPTLPHRPFSVPPAYARTNKGKAKEVFHEFEDNFSHHYDTDGNDNMTGEPSHFT